MDKKISKLILGTVQFGLDYGINNDQGKPSYEECKKILDLAWDSGIRTLDTAEVYGSSYEVISKYIQETRNEFRIHTKFKKEPDSLKAFLDNARERLHTKNVDIVYFHSFESFENAVANGMSFKDTLECELGVSIYTEDEFQKALSCKDISIIQIPFNLLDNKTRKEELLTQAKDKGIKIASRSCFLQGLFFRDTKDIPEKLTPLKEPIEKIKEISKDDIGGLAFNYPLKIDNIDHMLFGVDSVKQLEMNINSLNYEISTEQLQQIHQIKINNSDLINPSKW